MSQPLRWITATHTMLRRPSESIGGRASPAYKEFQSVRRRSSTSRVATTTSAPWAKSMVAARYPEALVALQKAIQDESLPRPAVRRRA